ncbi:hypothetical protein [Granulibacter bethesdensis]|nr:hypothetical protein [Granulibacter bethesdensis]
MNTEWDDLHNIAARIISPDSISIGKAELRQAASRAIKKIRWIKFLSIEGASLFAGVFLACLAGYIFFHLHHSPYHPYKLFRVAYYNLTIPALLMSIISLSVPELAQFRQPFKSWLRLPKECHPEALTPLFDSLAAGDWEAKTEKGFVPEYLFRSEWRILLVAGAEYKQRRRWVSYWWRDRYDGDIKARAVPRTLDAPERLLQADATQPISSTDTASAVVTSEKVVVVAAHEKPDLNKDPRYDWLAGGTYQEFQAGLDQFLKEKVPAHHEAALRRALTIGREELREGNPRKTLTLTINRIKYEVENMPRIPGVSLPAMSKSSLTNLLQGTYGSTSFKHYFLDGRQCKTE